MTWSDVLALATIATVVVWAPVMLVLYMATRPCGCGRWRPWFVNRVHRPRSMLVAGVGQAIMAVLTVAAAVVGRDVWFAVCGPAWVLSAFLSLRGYWWHERGKRRGLVSRMMGRVWVSGHGRLRVVPA